MTTRAGRLYRLWVALACCGLLLARPPRAAWACSCAQPAAPADAFLAADAVFSGTVTGVSSPSRLPLADWFFRFFPGQGQQSYDKQVSFQVNTAWKGVATTRATVRTGQGDGDCGFTFAPGRQYLVYAGRSAGELHTSICTRTNEVAFASADLAYLQTLRPLGLAPATASSAWAIGAFAALSLAALAVLLWASARSKARRLSA